MIQIPKLKHATLALAISCASVLPQAHAQFGSLLSAVTGGGSMSAAGDPDEFVKTALTAEKLMNNSVAAMTRALVSKEKTAEFDAARKAANTVADPKEREAKLDDVRKSEAAALNEATSNANFKTQIAKADGKKKEELGNAAFNFMLALLQDKALVAQSSGLIAGMSSNPMNLGKLGGVKDVVSSMGNQISAGADLALKMPEVFSAVGLKAPVSKDEKPKATAEVAGD
jgi:hypothetical protein